MMYFWSCFLGFVIFLLNLVDICNGGVTSSFVRKVEKTIDMPLDSDVFKVPPGYNAPQQVLLSLFPLFFFDLFLKCLNFCWFVDFIVFKVHITQGDDVGKGVIVSWITMDEPGSNTLVYWSGHSKLIKKARGKITTYKFYNYTSGYIHHCTINNLEVCLFSYHSSTCYSTV